MSKNCYVYTYNFFLKIKQKNYNTAKELSYDASIFVFWFFIVYLPKQNGNWIMAQGYRLSPILNDIFWSAELFAWQVEIIYSDLKNK